MKEPDESGAGITAASGWPALAAQVLEMEKAGLVTRTFRRLDPERQSAILEAILMEAAEHGLAELSMKRVASRAAVSVGSLYQYFGDRNRLLSFSVEVCRSYMDTVFSAALPWLETMPLLDALVAYVEEGCDWMSQQQSLMKLFTRAAYGGDHDLAVRLVRPVALRMRELLRALLEHGVARGEVSQSADLDAAVSVLHTLTCIIGDSRLIPSLGEYFQLRTTDGDAAPLEVRALIDTALHGITLRHEKNEF